jgi:hypothetical protein
VYKEAAQSDLSEGSVEGIVRVNFFSGIEVCVQARYYLIYGRTGGLLLLHRPCTMTVFDMYIKMAAEVSKAIRCKCREYFPGKPDSTKLLANQVETINAEVMFDKRIIKIYIVCYENPSLSFSYMVAAISLKSGASSTIE